MSFVGSALITGGSSGLGYSTARFIAQQRPNWKILIASRDGAQAATNLNAELKKFDGRNTPNVFFLPLDCSSRSAVRKFAHSYSTSLHPPIKALLFNAGIQIVSGVKYSVDGEELTFATNHTGQVLLFFLLRQYLSDDAHIIYTSSGLHKIKEGSRYTSAEMCAHPERYEKWDTPTEGRRRYALSKLANVLWLYALRKRAKAAGKKWTVAAFEPGFMPGTGLARDSSPTLRFIWLYILPNILFLLRRMIPAIYTPDQSAKVLARLAMNEGLVSCEDDLTAYWKHAGPHPSSAESYDVEKQDDLWNWTLKQIAEDEEQKMRFDVIE